MAFLEYDVLVFGQHEGSPRTDSLSSDFDATHVGGILRGSSSTKFSKSFSIILHA